jgi:TatD DNase family protein
MAISSISPCQNGKTGNMENPFADKLIQSEPYGPLCDIGANLLDEMFQGIYNNHRKHAEDISVVLERGKYVGVSKVIVTAGNIDECIKCQLLIKGIKTDVQLYTTAGIHPTRCSAVNENRDSLVCQLSELLNGGIHDKTVIAIGECGLDYDRLFFCDKDNQINGFIMQLELASKYQLPLFLHDRNTSGDFLRIISDCMPQLTKGGVVHSFTGTMDEMIAYTSLGLYIGVNGCSLKTEESLQVVSAIPLHLLLLETDAPWCGIKSSHSSLQYVKTNFLSKKREKYESGFTVKDRSEPCHMIQVLEVVATLKNMECSELANIVWENTNRLFFSS